jgi:hypothetical protein
MVSCEVPGGGHPPFGSLDQMRWFDHQETTVFNNALLQTRYRLTR